MRQKGRGRKEPENEAISTPYGQSLQTLQWELCGIGPGRRVGTPTAQLKKSGGVLPSESLVQGSCTLKGGHAHLTWDDAVPFQS